MTIPFSRNSSSIRNRTVDNARRRSEGRFINIQNWAFGNGCVGQIAPNLIIDFDWLPRATSVFDHLEPLTY